MSENKQVGVIERIEDIKVFSEKFKALNFVLNTGGEYPQSVQFQVSQDKADNFTQYNKVGDNVEVLFNLRGRNWTNPQGEVKTFNTLEVWRVNKIDSDIPKAIQQTEPLDDSEILPF